MTALSHPFTRHTLLPAALVVLAAAVSGCASPSGANGPPAGTAEYVGDLHGIQARAKVSFEPLREYTLMAGEIRSRVARYSFTADIVGTSGYGEMLDQVRNERFKVKIDLTRDGFTVTSNPFGPGTPSTYHFTKQ